MHMRFEGSKIRSVRPGEGTPSEFSSKPGKRARFFSTEKPPQTVGFIYVIRSEHELVQIGCSANPVAALAKLRKKTLYRVDVDFVGFVQVGAHLEVEKAAREALESHRINSGWFDCSPQIVIDAIKAAASRLGHRLIPTSVGDVEESLSAVAWAEAPRRGQAGSSQTYEKFITIGFIWAGVGVIGLLAARLTPGAHLGLIAGPCLLAGLIVTVLFRKIGGFLPPT